MSLLTKLQTIYGEIANLKADSEVKYKSIRYSYLSDAKLTKELHNSFAKHGLIMYPERVDIIRDEGIPKSVGRSIAIKVIFKLVDTETGEQLPIEVIGEGIDSGDKGYYKAMTGARKYALRLAFLLSTSDDPDMISSDELSDKLSDNDNVKPETKQNKPVRKEVKQENPEKDTWTMQEIFKVITPELKQAFSEMRVPRQKILHLFKYYKGNQQAILNYLKGGK